MKIAVIIFVFFVVIQTEALVVSSMNMRLRRAYNYERQVPSDTSYDVKREVLVLKLNKSTANVLFTTEPTRTSTVNQDRENREDSNRAITEDPFKYTTEQQIRTTKQEQNRTSNQEQIKTITEEQTRITTEEQIRTTTEANSSNEKRTVANRSEN